MKLPVKAFALLGVALILPNLAAADDESQSGNWADRVAFSGDFRLRYEEIEREGREKRDRARYRARIALGVAVADNVKLVLELASAADNPVSRNVTFDGGFSADDIGFDLAYVDWTPTDDLHVLAGKMKNPLYRAGGNPLIYDGDLNPEGIALRYGKGIFFANAGHFWVEERSDSDNSTLSAVQAGAKFGVGKKSKLTAGVGYFAYSNTVGNEPFYNGSARGNTVGLLGNYVYDYKDTEVFVAFDSKVGELPLSIFAHTTRNNEVDEQDTGVAYGAKIGSAKGEGQWEAGWTYQDIEADAVIGTFNDSDFGGGGTDASGHIIKAKYALSESIIVGGTLFISEINSFSLPKEDYDRLQLDVEFKFK